MSVMFAEYIWIDGTEPTPKLRSKTRAIHLSTHEKPDPKHWDYDEDLKDYFPKMSVFPDWGFDGSSTNQAPGDSSDCALKPVFFVPDPTRGDGHYLVMCEVMNADGTPHESNTRARLRAVMGLDEESEEHSEMKDCWFGLEQEYTLFKGARPLGFPGDRRHPAEQGPYYCGVGADEVYGRPLVEEHMKACALAGLKISGINAEVMPGQWEFQIGPAGPLEVGDHIWLARWLLYRLGEKYGISATLDPKPVPGDWNGAGMHTNFSTPAMRTHPDRKFKEHDPDHIVPPYGSAAIEKWCVEAGKHVQDHLDAYGDGIEMRLTGKHETCSYKDFKWGVSDRTASIRVPLQTANDGYGYLEDRRPNANADPYRVATVMLKTAYGLW